jgi:hypothetical protein
MFKYILTAISAAALLAAPAKADGLFMGVNWARSTPTSQAAAPPAYIDPSPRSEDTDGARSRKLMAFSVPAPFTGTPYAGPNTIDGACDQLQPQSWQSEGTQASLQMQATHNFYIGPNCAAVYYPGFAFFFGQPNMALAPHYDGGFPFVYGADKTDSRWGG